MDESFLLCMSYSEQKENGEGEAGKGGGTSAGGRGEEGTSKGDRMLFTCKSSAPEAASPRLGPGRSL